jgi:hypothetical protein
MKKIALLLALACVVIPAHASTWDEYRIVLKDGSWLTASERPEALDQEARMRLPNGLLAVEEMDLIDWQRTRAWNFQAIYLRNVIAGYAPVGVIPLEGESPYGEAIVIQVPEGDGPLGPGDVPVPLPDRQTLMRMRILDLAEDIGALKERRSVMEKAAATTSSPSRALELREQAEDLDMQVRALRSKQARLILQLPSHP